MRTVSISLVIALLSISALAPGVRADAPANDNLADARVVNPPTSWSQSTLGATCQPDINEQCPGHCNIGATVWLKFTAYEVGPVEIDTLGGTTYDSVLVAWRHIPGTSTLQFITCNDDFGGTLQSRILFDCVVGETYYIQVGGFNGAMGVNVQVDFSQSSCGDPPQIL